jgi:tripartite-type tricarboxylate transporter receptor subunit TctC
VTSRAAISGGIAARPGRLLSRWGPRAALGVPALLAPVAFAAAMPLDAPPAYPAKTLRIIVAASPGTSDDFFARAIGEELAAFYGKSFTVENRPGAGGLIGNLLVSRAKPDGHTLGMIGVTRMIAELMREQAPYRSLADVAAVAHVASITNVLAVTPALPARTTHEFLRQARARAGELNYASLGIGSASHLAGEIFTRALGVAATHVPFKNLSDTLIEMMLGRVHYAVLTLPSVLAALREERMRALAVMTSRRSPALPEVPAISELGLPEAQFDSWSGIVVPRATPRRIVEQLHGDIVRTLRKPALQALFAQHGAESTPESTPEGFARLMQSEYLRYQALIRERGIRPE